MRKNRRWIRLWPLLLLIMLSLILLSGCYDTPSESDYENFMQNNTMVISDTYITNGKISGSIIDDKTAGSDFMLYFYIVSNSGYETSAGIDTSYNVYLQKMSDNENGNGNNNENGNDNGKGNSYGNDNGNGNDNGKGNSYGNDNGNGDDNGKGNGYGNDDGNENRNGGWDSEGTFIQKMTIPNGGIGQLSRNLDIGVPGTYRVRVVPLDSNGNEFNSANPKYSPDDDYYHGFRWYNDYDSNHNARYYFGYDGCRDDDDSHDQDTQSGLTNVYYSNAFQVNNAQVTYTVDAYQDANYTQKITGGKLVAGKPVYLAVTPSNNIWQGNSSWNLYLVDSQGNKDILGSPVYDSKANQAKLKVDPANFTGNDATSKAIYNALTNIGIVDFGFEDDQGIALIPPISVRYYPDHFTVLSGPSLTLHMPSGNWAYLGEQVTLNMTLAASNANNQTAQGYDWTKFNSANPGNSLNISMSTGNTGLDSRIQANSPSLIPQPDGSAQYTVIFKVTTTVQNFADQVPNIVLQLTALDIQDNFGFKTTVQTAPANFYGGRVHILGGNYNQAQANVPVNIEYWNGSGWQVNADDSATTLKTGDLACSGASIQSISGFSQGKGTLVITNNSSNVTVDVNEGSSFPGYLGFVSEDINWGKIIQSPQNGGTSPPGTGNIIWENEDVQQ